MAITYPLTLLTATGIRSARFGGRSVVAVAKSPFTGEEQVQRHQGQWWEAEIGLPKMKRAEAEAWNSFRIKLNGRQGTFLLGDPDGASPRGTGGGTPLVKTGGSPTPNVRGDNELLTDGWNPLELVLGAGDYIQLGSGATARLHKVLDDVTSDSGGEATLTIWPDLRADIADNAPITVTNCVGVFRMASNEMSWDTDVMRLYGIGFQAVEAL